MARRRPGRGDHDEQQALGGAFINRASSIAELTELAESVSSNDSVSDFTFGEAPHVPPTEEMYTRHDQNLKDTIPDLDFADKGENRQFSPEYSQAAYQAMLADESVIGNYI